MIGLSSRIHGPSTCYTRQGISALITEMRPTCRAVPGLSLFLAREWWLAGTLSVECAWVLDAFQAAAGVFL